MMMMMFCFKRVRKTDIVKCASICQNIQKKLGDINKKNNMNITTKKEGSSVHTQLFIILFVIYGQNTCNGLAEARNLQQIYCLLCHDVKVIVHVLISRWD